jgi:transcriptional regulator with XRE-family HTH domain
MNNGAFLKLMGERVKKARKERKISLRKMSALCGTDMSNLYFLEQGRRNCHILTLKSIAEAFKMEVKDFI